MREKKKLNYVLLFYVFIKSENSLKNIICRSVSLFVLSAEQGLKANGIFRETSSQ